jgi:hypothetical protein
MMTDTSLGLSFLVARLNHPSGTVRERTCVALAKLLTEEETSNPTKAALQTWLNSQRFESVAISAILAWIRAKIEEPSAQVPESTEFVDGFPLPSILSWMLFQELYGSETVEPDWMKCCSGEPPPEFTADPTFHKNKVRVLEDSIQKAGQVIDDSTDDLFSVQWAWEWTRLVESVKCKTTDSVFRQRGNTDTRWYPSYTFRLTDAYASAFLRALAWTLTQGRLGLSDVSFCASMICPIDLDLWKIRPGSRPIWWPRVTTCSKVIDTAAGEVVTQLEGLWKTGIPGRNDWILAQASGYVGTSNMKFYLEIYGVFQWCVGRKEPDFHEVGNWCRTISGDTMVPKSMLGVTRKLLPAPRHSHSKERQFGHWVLSPTFQAIPLAKGSHWQFWRRYRMLWAPASYLFDRQCELVPDREAMYFQINDETIGLWMDWTDGLTEQIDVNLPPFTGSCLLLKRDLLDSQSFPAHPTICWIWTLTAFHREYDSGRYNLIGFEGEIGATRLVLG